MRLAAIATAAGVPDGGFAGTVEHVYPRVCLLGLADQTLVTLATSAVGHLPRGITLDWSAEFLSHVAPGSEFAARAGILRFSASTLSVDLRRSQRWQCDLTRLKLDINSVPVRQAWQAARDALRRDGRSSGLQRAAGSAIRDLAAATRGFAAGAAGEIVSALVGLGEGTTPAADDFLVGYVAGLLSSVGIIEARSAPSIDAVRTAQGRGVANTSCEPALSRGGRRRTDFGAPLCACDLHRHRSWRGNRHLRRGGGIERWP